jgi:translation initiation factor IF-2
MLTSRPPIIVILGHVDHGKTTLLDYLHKSNTAAREPGSITQHIRSFQLQTTDYGLLTFIDTPGHAAFSAMRDRGSHVADLAVLVIAADDGVMPQTKESLEFIKSSGIPFIVAISKIDLPTADADHVKTQLTENQVVVEDFGGEVPAVLISAKTGQGITDLLEMIHLVTSLNPPQADLQGPLELVVLESRLDSQKGPLATVVVKNGTLNVGQELFQAGLIGKARALIDPEGQNIKSALPAQPVQILGLTLVPEVGTSISDRSVSVVVSMKQSNHEAMNPDSKLNLILRADFAGSLEAILGALPPEVNVLFSGTGDVTENDILQARPPGAQVIGFNSKVSHSISKLAQTEKVTVQTFNIIYELLDYLDKQINSAPVETVVGRAQVLADFKINSDRIAGCRCLEGTISKSAHVRLERAGQVIGSTRIKSLKVGKTDTPLVKSGVEFGAVFAPYVDFKIGDDIIATTG